MKSRRGFTIVEVSLFLAVSGLLFAGIVASSGISVARERFNTAAQDFAEFLRDLYSETKNVQNSRDVASSRNYCTLKHPNTGSYNNNKNLEQPHGRSECAIYGKIAIFNEKISDSDNSNNSQIKVYDVIGNVIDAKNELQEKNNTLAALKEVYAGYIALGSNDKRVPAGNSDTYTPEWSSHIETTVKDKYFSGALMIVRSPIDGSIHTYVYESASRIPSSSSSSNNDIYDYIASSKFKEQTVNFCLNSADAYAYNGRRRNIRIRKDYNKVLSDNEYGRSNSSIVELIDLDSGDNKCV